MSIETLDDIVEELADGLGIYGAHGEEHPDGQCECRMCFSMGLNRRIREAVQSEQAIGASSADEKLGKVIDIMQALKESLDFAPGGNGDRSSANAGALWSRSKRQEGRQ